MEAVSVDDKVSMEIDENSLEQGEDKLTDESSDDDDDQDDQNEQAAAALESKVAANLYDYNGHLELIKLLQSMGELDRLRKARERMSQCYPLSPDLWLAWLRDEQKIMTTGDEFKAMVNLFERAVKDYLSVEVWLEYAQFSIGGMSSEGGIEMVRSVFERAVIAAGLHVPKGALLWEVYREFENVVISMTVETKPLLEQLKKIATLFRRQLSCPLMNMENAYTEFEEWLDSNRTKWRELTGDESDPVDKTQVEMAYKKALSKLHKVQPYEDVLVTCSDSDKAGHYKEYLRFEQTDGNEPSRLQCLFERAVTDCPLDGPLWLCYVEYIDETLRMDTVTLPTCERAVRNCPWFSLLWQIYLRCMERYGKPHSEIKGVLEQALQAGMQTAEDYRNLWLEYCSYVRRRIKWGSDDEESQLTEFRDSVNQACEHLAQYFGLDGDPTCQLLRMWATVEANGHNVDRARKIWDDILSQGHNRTASSWLQYIHLEIAYGDSKHIRKLFARALQATQDWPESIAEEWLNFERAEGMLDTYEAAMLKCRSRLKQIALEREKAAQKEESKQEKHGRQKHGRGQKDAVEGKKGERDQKNKHQQLQKVSPEENKERLALKRPAPQEKEEPKKRSAPPPGYKPDSPKKPKLDVPAAVDRGVVAEHDPSKDDRTVFVSNLDYATDDDKVREVFSSVGTITELRLVKDFKGRSKGFCYVVFSSHEEAAEALKKDREPVDGRPMFVSKCDPDRHTRQPGFKWSTNLEKNKLFVKGLPLSMTKEDVEKLFAEHGRLKDVRLVTYRNGHFKGLAYVDFCDEASASQALIKVDGTTIEDKVISVALSNPPDRRTSLIPEQQETTSTSFLQSLGGGVKETGARGRGRTQVSFIPRSLQVQSEAKTDSSRASSSNGSAKSKSNADFRQMLLSKK